MLTKAFFVKAYIIFPGSNISLLTKEELDKIFSDKDASLRQEFKKKPALKVKIIRTTKVTDDCDDIFVANNSGIEAILKRVENDNKSRDKTIKRTLLKRIRKSLLSLFQKLAFRKKTDYYKRMAAIKRQWVMLDFFSPMKEILINLLKAEMPPGWRKAVKSGTLMESFARVDKYRWDPKRSNISRRCGLCSQETGDNSQRTIAVSDLIVDILQNMECQRYSRDQLVNVLGRLKHLAKHDHQNDQGWIILVKYKMMIQYLLMFDPESGCLVDEETPRLDSCQLSSSRSPYLTHLLHLTGTDLSSLTSPNKEVMVYLVYIYPKQRFLESNLFRIMSVVPPQARRQLTRPSILESQMQ